MYRYYEAGTTNGVEVYLDFYPVIRETSKGKWIGHSEQTKRFVRNLGRKRYAWETKEKAMESFIARKKCQIKWLSTKLVMAKTALNVVGAREHIDIIENQQYIKGGDYDKDRHDTDHARNGSAERFRERRLR